MKNFLLLLLSVVLFSTVLFAGLFASYNDRIRPAVYYYPNGYVSHVVSGNESLFGDYLNTEQLLIRGAISLDKLLPLNVSEGKRFGQFTEQAEIPLFFPDKTDILLHFIPEIMVAMLFLVTSVWFYSYMRDIHLTLMFFLVYLLVILNVFVLSYHAFLPLFFTVLFFSGFHLLNLSFRLRGREVSIRWLFPEAAISMLLGLAGVDPGQKQVFHKLVSTGIFFLLLSSAFFFISQVTSIIRGTAPGGSFFKRTAIPFSLLIGIIIPVLLVYFRPEYNLRYYIYASMSAFPFLFIFGSYNYTIVPIQLLFSRSVNSIFLMLFYLVIYLAGVIVLTVFLPEVGGTTIAYLNLFFVVMALFVIEPVSNAIYGFMEYWNFGRNVFLKNSLLAMSGKISSPVSIKATIASILKEITVTLGVDKVIILMPSTGFPEMKSRNLDIIRIPASSDMWRYFSHEKDVIITAHLAYGTGTRGAVYRFLKEFGIQVAYPIFYSTDENVSALFLIGEKQKEKNFTLGELTYIKECARSAGMIMKNYSLLIDDIEKKKLVRDLGYAAILDNTLNIPSQIHVAHTELGYCSIPAVGISGDYIDIIPLSSSDVMVFLGDVTGHGLGSGYIVSAIRGIIREQIRSGGSLEEIFGLINTFFIERYSGHEFMTLIGGIMYSEFGTFEYINAGHVPIIKIDNAGNTAYLKDSEKVLGVVPTHYTSMTASIENGERIYIYSDGIIELFNERDEIYGMNRLEKFIRNNRKLPPVEIVREIERDLERFRGRHEQSDDISLICLESKKP